MGASPYHLTVEPFHQKFVSTKFVLIPQNRVLNEEDDVLATLVWSVR